MTFHTEDIADKSMGSGSLVDQDETQSNNWPLQIADLDSKEFDVIAFGHAIVDIMVSTTESILSENGFNKGTMQLTESRHEGEEILKKLRASDESTEILMTSGGSAGNTIYALAKLGLRTGFLGTVFDDDLGRQYINEFEKSSVRCFFSPKSTSDIEDGDNEALATGRCNVFITPDKDRTMLTYLGASAKFNPDEIHEMNLASAGIIYAEGYLFDSISGSLAVIQAAEAIKESSTLFSLSLSDPFVVDRYRHVILNLVEEGKIDLLFGNLTEARILSAKESIEDVAEFFYNHDQVAVVTDGANGSYCIYESEPIFVPAIKSDRVADTTGAGDTFAAGTLVGLLRGFSIERSLNLGSIVAKEVIEHIGPRPNDDIGPMLKHAGFQI